MKRSKEITTLFLDIGEVLLNNGWDHFARKRAATYFKLEWSEMEERHSLNFGTYEEGKLTLEEYLSRTVFYEERPFTRDQFRAFMFEQSQPYPDMIGLMTHLKARYGLKIAAVSNEARELNAYRIDTFNLGVVIDAFISSCYVHLRKPDVDIFRFALDIIHVQPQEVVFIDNTLMFVQIAEGLGIQGIHHIDYTSTCAKLAALGLENDEEIARDPR